MIWPLNIIDVWGIGSRMQKRLNGMGIYKLGDIAKTRLSHLKRHFGIMGEQLYMHAWGVDLSPVFVDPLAEVRKGIGSGITLMSDYNKQDARTVIIELTDHLTAKLRRYKVAAYTVSLSLRYSHVTPLKSYHKAHTLYAANNLTSPFVGVLEQLLEQATDAPIRHIGISFTNLVDESAIQIDLFDREQHMKLLRLSKTIDYITHRYGSNAIYRAVSNTSAGTWLDRGHKIGGHYE
ncbi:DNA polymerase thumb domain-containing protein [Paenibacillus sp. WLX2291]|uniref:DinB/UmuC family translesion DNA polymerase n=1 Tax=Paenibacillus sp. WLX2291 TaxID=3296934 RepID=UPI003983F712